MVTKKINFILALCALTISSALFCAAEAPDTLIKQLSASDIGGISLVVIKKIDSPHQGYTTPYGKDGQIGLLKGIKTPLAQARDSKLFIKTHLAMQRTDESVTNKPLSAAPCCQCGACNCALQCNGCFC